MVVFHQHEDGHQHTAPAFNTAFIIAIAANGLFVLIQIIFAYVTHSTSLLADAIHNLGDVLSLILAWVASNLLKRLPTQKSTYGMKKTTILASFANGVLLIFTCGIIATEAMYKFFPLQTFRPSVLWWLPELVLSLMEQRQHCFYGARMI
ncbi:cation diffusion facilitator family transporter [Legionella oakridgensis ATCC 33761 = DSM 21215]|uniref:Cation diffusion facilitator family transporter n=1 Tax=Legionella oakridgensis ATCC 33761 = DSM 21215 TaxID=1268635 RepID=W0B6A0_9GAMM|nr:cation diffusion facilitator family transporter [Legionella oakridgensis ATCC 33761 = DSM 21215]